MIVFENEILVQNTASEISIIEISLEPILCKELVFTQFW